MKVLEESLRAPSGGSSSGGHASSGPLRRQSLGGADSASSAKISSNGFFSRRSSSQLRSSSLSSSASMVLKHAKGSSKSFDGGSRSNLERRKAALVNGSGLTFPLNKSPDSEAMVNSEVKPVDSSIPESEDMVSGLLYELLQKEVVSLRKAVLEKDQSLKDKDDAIEVQIFVFT